MVRRDDVAAKISTNSKRSKTSARKPTRAKPASAKAAAAKRSTADDDAKDEQMDASSPSAADVTVDDAPKLTPAGTKRERIKIGNSDNPLGD